MFSGCTSLTEIRGIESIDTSSVIDFDYIFKDCESLVSLDLTNADTSAAQRADGAFEGCINLSKLVLGSRFSGISEAQLLLNGGGWVNQENKRTVISGSGEYAVIPASKAGGVYLKKDIANASPKITADKVQCLPDGTVNVPVTLSGFSSLGEANMIAFKLKYDAPVEMIGYSSGDAGAQSDAPVVNSDTNIISFISSYSTTPFKNGTLMTLSFNVPLGAAPGTYPLTFSDVTLYDEDTSPIPITVADGSINVTIPDSAVQLTASSIVAAPGESVAYSVYADKNPGYDTVSLVMNFDPSLTVRKESSVANGAYTISGPAALTSSNVCTLNKSAGWVSFVDTGKASSKTGKLFTIYFNIPEDAEDGEYPITLSQYKATLDGEQITVYPVYGSVTVRKHIKGDVNYDGAVNIADAVLLQKWLLGVPETHLPYWKSADICEDGTVDTFDMAMLRTLLIEDSTEYTVKLLNAGENTSRVAVIINNYLGCGLQTAKEMAEAAPVVITTSATKADTEQLTSDLSLVGAEAAVTVTQK